MVLENTTFLVIHKMSNLKWTKKDMFFRGHVKARARADLNFKSESVMNPLMVS